MSTWQFTILLIVFIGILFLLIRLVYREGFSKVFNIAAFAARVRIILKSWRFVPITLITIDENGQIILANPKTTKDFGWTEDELLGKKMDILIPEEHRKSLEKFKILNSDNYLSDYIEIEGLKKDGNLLPIEVRVEKWTDEDFFKTPFYTITLRNIKHRKDNESAAIQAARQVVEILELSSMGMGILNAGAWSWDLVEDRMTGDDGYNKIFNFKPWEVVRAVDLMEIVYFEDRNQVDAAMQKGFEAKERYEIKYRISKKDGSRDLIYCIGIPQQNKKGHIIKINGIVQVIKENVP